MAPVKIYPGRMGLKEITVTLQGGPRNGEEVMVYRGQPWIYITQRLTYEQAQRLMIDDRISWKWPEDVYVRLDNRVYVYEKTVHYKPEDFVTEQIKRGAE